MESVKISKLNFDYISNMNNINPKNPSQKKLTSIEPDTINLTNINLSLIEDYDLSNIKEGIVDVSKTAAKVTSKLVCSTATLTLSLVEGVAEVGEHLLDGGLALATKAQICENKVDTILTGTNHTLVNEALEKQTMATIKKEHVNSVFNTLYNDTKAGKTIKNKSYAFKGVRNFGNEVGKDITNQVLTKTALGMVFSAISNYGEGVEKSWKDGASYNEGLKSSIAYAAGKTIKYKIESALNFGAETKLEKIKAAGVDSSTEVIDSLTETFSDSLKEGYKNSKGKYIKFDKNDSYLERLSKSFAANGGIKELLTQASAGMITSGFSSIINQRIINKANLNKMTKEFKTVYGVDGDLANDLYLDQLEITPNELVKYMQLDQYKHFSDNEFNAYNSFCNGVPMKRAGYDQGLLSHRLKLLGQVGGVDAQINYAEHIKKTVIDKYYPNMEIDEVINLLTSMNSEGGICTHATIASQISKTFKETSELSELFKKKFGFDLVDENREVINMDALLTDIYINANPQKFKTENNKTYFLNQIIDETGEKINPYNRLSTHELILNPQTGFLDSTNVHESFIKNYLQDKGIKCNVEDSYLFSQSIFSSSYGLYKKNPEKMHADVDNFKNIKLTPNETLFAQINGKHYTLQIENRTAASYGINIEKDEFGAEKEIPDSGGHSVAISNISPTTGNLFTETWGKGGAITIELIKNGMTKVELIKTAIEIIGDINE